MLTKQLRHSRKSIIRRGSSAGDPLFVGSQILRKSLQKRSICVFVTGPCDLMTLKMAALCGRGGAGRDGDIVLSAGGWFRVDGPLIEALTDLEFKEEMISNYTLYYINHNTMVIYFKLRNQNKLYKAITNAATFTKKKKVVK